MDGLKALLAKKKAEKQELVGDKKFVRRGELEEARLKRLRGEEAVELQEKESKRKRQQGAGSGDEGAAGGADAGALAAAEAAAAAAEADAAALRALAALPRAEVFRRLRALGQPVALFGEDDGERAVRLARVEREAALVDDDARYGGQQENTMLALAREERWKRKGGPGGGGGEDGGGGGASGAGAGGDKARGGGGGGGGGGEGKAGKQGGGAKGEAANGDEAAPGPDAPAPGSDAPGGGGGGGGQAGGAGAPGGGGGGSGSLEDAFAEAAARLAEQRAEESLPLEDRIHRYLRRWCQEWEDDLEARPEAAKASGPGHQATMVFRQSMRFMEPLWRQLESRTLDDELKVGLWMMVTAMRQRNYLAANDVYLKLAIGNSPWPIGVTSVGIHERSAREKISHVMNASGKAHIMNDEATRKYFQAIKRLTSVLQRLYPTDPSRSVDFNLTCGEGRGAAGGGSQKMALLEAEQKGETWRALGLEAAPHYMARDGSVAIPRKWDNVLADEMARAGVVGGGGGSGDEGGGGQGQGQQQQRRRPKTPSSRPVTPPGAVK
ncbi:pre-mRNA-splicing factor [Raphidocelis subcapitata]|uniref:Pre-mRNA-splicing factor 18 n=1 Tax=Raphidocelis subcapitata TaxID=307507 RepID=A0A2V0PJ19_9CHLO|nr:pre-mRNA-splicing factor [Raphidocelis subcapitata]|eukprot:GBF99791.1 pre-mRNA-splicing factor [Raphidocelis subcapitata]